MPLTSVDMPSTAAWSSWRRERRGRVTPSGAPPATATGASTEERSKP
ncbi:hypothetical protein MUK42_31024 [Musa troglodytarum]|uniref:Uncharacterized protein n=1 Tax=Musa troglodytarum TaxID=320322 RepID=A0A9E7FPC2_9LILI|nr:hypothetical protein MUK42_31024 [Musa troglodytarum]